MNEWSLPPSPGDLLTNSPQVNTQEVHLARNSSAAEISVFKPRLGSPSSPAPEQPIRTVAREAFPRAGSNDILRRSFFPADHGYVTAGRSAVRIDRSAMANQSCAKQNENSNASISVPSFGSNEHSSGAKELKDGAFLRDGRSDQPSKPLFGLKTLSFFLLSRRT